jgi:integrase
MIAAIAKSGLRVTEMCVLRWRDVDVHHERLVIEAGAPLPYVMSQVGHADSRTTLEIYAQVQKRLSHKKRPANERSLEGGRYWARTSDLLLVRQALYQLS